MNLKREIVNSFNMIYDPVKSLVLRLNESIKSLRHDNSVCKSDLWDMLSLLTLRM